MRNIGILPSNINSFFTLGTLKTLSSATLINLCQPWLSYCTTEHQMLLLSNCTPGHWPASRWSKVPDTYRLQEESFILAQCQKVGSKAEMDDHSAWWRKAVHTWQQQTESRKKYKNGERNPLKVHFWWLSSNLACLEQIIQLWSQQWVNPLTNIGYT